MATEILKEIRDEIRKVRTELRGIRSETVERFGMVEAALLDLVEYQAARPIEPRLVALELRVDKLEPK